MHIAGPNSWLAPLATGHPLGLPAAPRKPAPHLRVTPPPQFQKSSGFDQGQSPAAFWRASAGTPNPDTHIAPPSIMQIKISQMLDTQARAQQDRAAPAGPEPVTAFPEGENSPPVRSGADPLSGIPAPSGSVDPADQPTVAATPDGDRGRDREPDQNLTNPAPTAPTGQPALPAQAYGPVDSLARNSVFRTLP